MRRSLLARVGVLACSSTALLTAVTLAPSASGAPTGPASGSAGTAALARPLGAQDVVRSTLLPTGETVSERTRPHAAPVVRVLGAGTRDVEVLTLPGHTYALPKTAVPYLGRLLDLGLFDTTALSGTARVPVRLTYSGAVPRVPGVTLTSSSRGDAAGYITASSARAFGAALTRQYDADRRAGWPHRSTLFGARSISLGGARAAAASTGRAGIAPRFVQRTLSVKGVGSDGKPVKFGFVILVDVEEGARYSNAVFIENGEARVSVPDGTYAAIGDVGGGAGFTLDTVEGFEVRGPGRTLTLDARRATAVLSVKTPRAATATMTSFDWTRIDAPAESFFSASFMSFGGGRIRVTPQREPAIGELYSSSGFSLAGRPRTGLPYTYDAFYGSVGVPAAQAHVLRPQDLAEVDAHYYVNGTARLGGMLRAGILASLPVGGSAGAEESLRLPTRRREYVLATPGLLWSEELFTDPAKGGGASFDQMVIVDAGLRAERARTVRVEEWLRGPLRSKVPYQTPADVTTGFAECLACRDRDGLLVVLAPGDTDPTHTLLTFSTPGRATTRFLAYKDGVLIADRSDALGVALTVPPQRGTYRFVESVDRRGSGDRLSTGLTTDVTTVSGATGGGALPAALFCELEPPCTALSLLQAEVTLPADSFGVVNLGTRTIRVHLGHSQWSAATRVTGAKVQVRVAGGGWVSLPLAGRGSGVFEARLHTTRAQAGRYVDLRVTGTDAAGGRLVQTTTRAFVLAR